MEYSSCLLSSKRVRPARKFSTNVKNVQPLDISISIGVFHVVDYDFDVRLLKFYKGRPLLREKNSIRQ